MKETLVPITIKLMAFLLIPIILILTWSMCDIFEVSFVDILLGVSYSLTTYLLLILFALIDIPFLKFCLKRISKILSKDSISVRDLKRISSLLVLCYVSAEQVIIGFIIMSLMALIEIIPPQVPGIILIVESILLINYILFKELQIRESIREKFLKKQVLTM